MPKYYEISISYTLRCNASCAHCCVTAGPRRRATLALSDVKKYIRAASRYGIKFIAFTGGEVTLIGDELFDALSYCKGAGIRTILVTNGHWASNRESAHAFVAALRECGVIEAQLSTDGFHVPFVPFENILTAIGAFRANGIRPMVMFARMIGDRRTEDLRRAIAATGVEIVQQPVVPFTGRSQALPPTRLYSQRSEGMKQVGCISVLSPTISPGGKVYACCASDFSFADSSGLCLGNLKDESLLGILRGNERNRVLDAIYLWGPKYLYDVVREQEPALIQHFPDRYFGHCHLCYALLKNRRIVALLRKFLETDEMVKRIEIAKLVKHEKIRQMPDKANDWYECVLEREKA